jgi:acetyl esterase
MWQKSKVWVLRKFYHFISNWGWRGHALVPKYHALEIPGRAGPIQARIYANSQGANRPLIIYFHGGGWVIGDLDTHQPFCQVLNDRSGCTVISVDYRLAPEHPFPAAHNDSVDATRWIAGHIDKLGPCNQRLVLAGDSAGANLATCVCLELDANPALCKMLAGAVVKYPVVDHYQADRPSFTQRATGQSLTSKLVIWFWDTYLGDCSANDSAAKRAMPLHASNLASLPPTFLITAEFDPLRDEGIAYAEKLRESGVALQYRHFDNAAHGFACSEGPSADFNAYMDDLVAWLARLS